MQPAGRMSDRAEIPARLSPDGRTATWNPALTRSNQLVLRVRLPGGAVELRRSMNSGRAKVREGERIESVEEVEGV